MRRLPAVIGSLLLVPTLVAFPRLVPHDVHEPCPLPTPEANDVRRVAVHPDGAVWAATRGGVFRRDPTSKTWSAIVATAEPTANTLAPAFDVTVAPDGVVWIGAWNGLFRVRGASAVRVPGLTGPVAAVGASPDGVVLAGGPDGFHEVRDGAAARVTVSATRYLERIRARAPGEWWLATGMGGFVRRDAAEAYLPADADTVSAAIRDIAFADGERVWLAALGGLHEYRNGRFRRTLTPRDGLPSTDVRCVVPGADGRLWVGTASGVARWDGVRWEVRAGRRWLLEDDVRDLALDADGTAWIATPAGVSALRSTRLTLAAKARHFHAILEARHVRPPGIVEKCRLRRPGDLSSWEPEDDDNDGGYTALAMAMEAYRHAATGDPAALAAARRALAACEFLLDVTGPDGFLARSVIPATWREMHDPNENLADPVWAEHWMTDPRNKRVPVRWRPSPDGQWLWKGDTSSDEVTAHCFGYFVMHELAPDDADRNRVRRQVARIVDHLLRHGLVLRDLDGRPTRWGVWAPEALNDSPDWAMERGINSVEILSFLKLAHRLTGDPRYAAEYRRLIEEHHYDRNVREAPNLNPAWRTYIDLELLAFAYPALLAYEEDPRLHRLYRRSFERWHQAVRADGNPFFEFLYARHGNRLHARLDDAMAFLRDTPLDLIRWDVDLSRREDLVLRRSPEVERWQTDRLCPPSEIGYSRTDQNPWLARQGDGGRSESDGVFWLLPYWMGRHHGWIADDDPGHAIHP